MPPKTRAAAARKTNRRKVSKNIVAGQAHIKSTFNNTIVSITDPTGAVISWSSAGDMGFKGSRKSTPYAAQLAAEAAANRAKEHRGENIIRWRPLQTAPRSTASARSTSSSRAPVPVAKPQSVPCRLQASRSVRFRTFPPLHTTAAVLRSVAASN